MKCIIILAYISIHEGRIQRIGGVITIYRWGETSKLGTLNDDCRIWVQTSEAPHWLEGLSAKPHAGCGKMGLVYFRLDGYMILVRSAESGEKFRSVSLRIKDPNWFDESVFFVCLWHGDDGQTTTVTKMPWALLLWRSRLSFDSYMYSRESNGFYSQPDIITCLVFGIYLTCDKYMLDC